MCIFVSAAISTPVSVFTENDPIQDDWSANGWVDELGNKPAFPDDEWITSEEVTWTGHIPCETDFTGYFNLMKQVRITNETDKSFVNLVYVADELTCLTNIDEKMGQAGSSSTCGAFLIDAVGENTPLVSESFSSNGIFEPGESWEFVIQEYKWEGLALLGPELFGSQGIAGMSYDDIVSTGSIIVIPEPATLSLLALGSLAMLRKRR